MSQYSHARLPVIPDRDKPITFSSWAEYATGMLLERYIGNFELRMGSTFQVPIGHNKQCDFLINGVFVEFHPINLKHEFADRQAFRQFSAALRHVDHPFRGQIIAAIRNEMGEKYYQRRKFLINMHGGKDAELLVITNPVELYQQVIKRFATSYPKQHTFTEEFAALCKDRH
jgi:hypothetical protein